MAAREVAQKEFDESMAQPGNRFSRIIRGVIRGNMLREYHRHNSKLDAQQRIADTGRLYDMDQSQWDNVAAASIQRVVDDQGTGEFMNQHDGETRSELTGDAGTEIKSTVNQLITEYVGGSLSAADIREEAGRRFADLANGNEEIANLLGAGNVYMSNILEIAQAVQGQITHERGIEQVLTSIDFVSARVNTDVHTEAKASRVERFLDNHAWPSNSVTAGIAVLYGVGAMASKGAIGAATKVGVLGGGAGVMAYFQEKARLVHERANVAREAAVGENVSGTERRERLAQTLYDMKDASVITEAMQGFRNDAGEYAIADQAQYDGLLVAALDMTARYDLSAQNKADYIRFSSRETVQQERREMLMERFRAKAALRSYYDTQLAADPTFNSGVDFDMFYDNSIEAMQQGLVANAETQDASYKKLSRELSRKKALQALAFGAAAGVLIPEIISPFMDSKQGVVESAMNNNLDADNATVLASGANWLRDTIQARMPNTDSFTPHTIGGSTISLDSELNLDIQDGKATLTGPNDLHMSMPINPDGSISSATKDQLHAAGVDLTDFEEHVKSGETTVDKEVSVKAYAEAHGQDVRRSWFDNDTTKFDKNELRLDLKTNGNGDFVYSAARMVEGGSHHAGDQASVDFEKLKMLVSPEKGVQSSPLMLDMDSNGNVVIPKGSNVAQFFTMEDGKPVFRGAYAEVVEVKGTATDGKLNVGVLATHVGSKEDFPTVMDQVTKPTSEVTHTFTLEYNGETRNPDMGVEPGFFPFVSRGGLRKSAPAGREGTTQPPEQGNGGPAAGREVTTRPPEQANNGASAGGREEPATRPEQGDRREQPRGTSFFDRMKARSQRARGRRADARQEQARQASAEETRQEQARQAFAEQARQSQEEARQASAEQAAHQEQADRAAEQTRQEQARQASAEQTRQEQAKARSAAEQARQRQEQADKASAEKARREEAEKRAAEQERQRQEQADRAAEQARRRREEAQRVAEEARKQRQEQEPKSRSTPVQEAQNGDEYRKIFDKHEAAKKNRDYWKRQISLLEESGDRAEELEKARARMAASKAEVVRLRRELNRTMHGQNGDQQAAA